MCVYDNKLKEFRCLPGASLMAQTVKNLPANAGDLGSILGLERSPGGGHGNPLQYSCLEIPRTEEPGGIQFIGLNRVRQD